MGWLAMRFMGKHNLGPTRTGIQRLKLSGEHDVFVELGAGHGYGLQEVASDETKVPKRIVNVEISPEFRKELETMKATLKPDIADRVEIHGDDCITMPYLEDASVDRIFGMNVVYFLDPLAEYAQEFHRVLKPAVGSVTFGCHLNMLPENTKEFVNTEEEPIVKLLEEAGFSVEVERHLEPSDWTEIKATKKP